MKPKLIINRYSKEKLQNAYSVAIVTSGGTFTFHKNIAISLLKNWIQGEVEIFRRSLLILLLNKNLRLAVSYDYTLHYDGYKRHKEICYDTKNQCEKLIKEFYDPLIQQRLILQVL